MVSNGWLCVLTSFVVLRQVVRMRVRSIDLAAERRHSPT
ncbi:unnamed protein product [Brassica oleracea var. botrytis]|uniref:(rape) hypothetical protein n=1 Tax=Brassica napus TaxID=3708 RepID=A0A816KHF6_BRANA|nr:unnamed protein product [Brassica napus]